MVNDELGQALNSITSPLVWDYLALSCECSKDIASLRGNNQALAAFFDRRIRRHYGNGLVNFFRYCVPKYPEPSYNIILHDTAFKLSVSPLPDNEVKLDAEEIRELEQHVTETFCCAVTDFLVRKRGYKAAHAMEPFLESLLNGALVEEAEGRAVLAEFLQDMGKASFFKELAAANVSGLFFRMARSKFTTVVGLKKFVDPFVSFVGKIPFVGAFFATTLIPFMMVLIGFVMQPIILLLAALLALLLLIANLTGTRWRCTIPSVIIIAYLRRRQQREEELCTQH